MWTRELRPNNMVINDPKGELLQKFYVPGTYRGFQIVQFNLINAMNTDIYNRAKRTLCFCKVGWYCDNRNDRVTPWNCYIDTSAGGTCWNMCGQKPDEVGRMLITADMPDVQKVNRVRMCSTLTNRRIQRVFNIRTIYWHLRSSKKGCYERPYMLTGHIWVQARRRNLS